MRVLRGLGWTLLGLILLVLIVTAVLLGTASGNIPRGRRNRTGGSLMRRQPVDVTSTARHASSPRSR